MRNKLEDEDTPDDIGFHTYEGKHDAIMANQTISPGEGVRFNQLKINEKIVTNPRFVLMESLGDEVIIGAETMQELGIILDFKNEKLIF